MSYTTPQAAEIDQHPLEVDVERLPQFAPLYEYRERGINLAVLIGGRGGAKTYEASKFAAYEATMDRRRTVVLRDEKVSIKESILAEILARYDTANEEGVLGQMYERLDTGIKERATGDMVVFTMGFRASNSTKKSNLKGVSGVDIAIIEEAEDIRDEDRFNTFHDSIRKAGALVVIILNTPDLNHWIIERYFDTAIAKDENGAELDGFFEIQPKKNIPNFLCIKTSFEDNPFLDPTKAMTYRAYGDPKSATYNRFYYLTAIKGLSTSGRKGQILTKVKPISLEDYLALPFKEFYGQDYGMPSPAGLVGVKFDKNNCYCREINYLPMDAITMGIFYHQLGFDEKDKIVSDPADKDTLEKLQAGWTEDELTEEQIIMYPKLLRGFYVVKAKKGPGSIKAGLKLMNGMNLFAVSESKNLWKEINGYIWAVDKNKRPTDEPMDDMNHLIDPWRYVIQDRDNSTDGLHHLAGYFG